MKKIEKSELEMIEKEIISAALIDKENHLDMIIYKLCRNGNNAEDFFTNSVYKVMIKYITDLYKQRKYNLLELVNTIAEKEHQDKTELTKILGSMMQEEEPIIKGLQIDKLLNIIIATWYNEKIRNCDASSAEGLSMIHNLTSERDSIINDTNNNASVLDYFDNGIFDSDLDEYMKMSAIPTGFTRLDKAMSGGLYPGLYVLGAASSLGKTTFIHQICDNIASCGVNVIYYSLEMSRMELITKSLARLQAQNQLNGRTYFDKIKGKTALEMRRDGVDEELKKQYRNKIAGHMYIVEGNFNTDVDYIKRYTKLFTKQHKGKTIIAIDYLQIMTNASLSEDGIRAKVDSDISELKRLSRDLKIPVIVISSISRSNYNNAVSIDTYKESGGIEYTVDVALGLELKVLTEKEKKKALQDQNASKNSNNKQSLSLETLEDEYNRIPREITLRGVKNRYGNAKFKVQFKYNPVFDVFVEEGSDNAKCSRMVIEE